MKEKIEEELTSIKVSPHFCCHDQNLISRSTRFQMECKSFGNQKIQITGENCSKDGGSFLKSLSWKLTDKTGKTKPPTRSSQTRKIYLDIAAIHFFLDFVYS